MTEPSGTAAPCDHDWRINPFLVTASHPALFVVECAKCPAVKNAPMTTFAYPLPNPSDKATWPPFKEQDQSE